MPIAGGEVLLPLADLIDKDLPGLTVHDLMLLPVARLKTFFDTIATDITDEEIGRLAMSELTDVPTDLQGSAAYRTRVGAAMVARPIGAVIFGHLGDRIGRKQTFLATVLLMGISTVLVALLPTYSTAGVFAPIALVALRMLQGLALGGEYGGAVIYVAEHAPQHQRGAYTGWIQTTATIGLLLSLLVVLGVRTLLGEAAFADWGWRVPFGLSALTLGSAPAQAQAQAFPTKPVSLMVPYPAGGLSDAIARVVEKPLSKALGQMVIVENLGDVSGALGAQKVLGAPADGHFLYQGSPNELILAPLAVPSIKYKSEDFRQVHRIALAPMAIFARAGLPVANADELVAYAAKVAKEGKPLTYASVGVGSFYHLLGAKMSKDLGIEMSHVPYKGAADAFRDLAGNQVDIFITPYGLAQTEFIKQGKLKAVVTQNIDGLHQAAGSQVVYELHGSIHRNYCEKCGRFYDAGFVKAAEGVPVCSCGGRIKPDVVLYEEALDGTIIEKAVRAISQADMLIIGGTSLVVYPAAGFIDYFRGKYLVVINKSEMAKAVRANLSISAPIGEILGRIKVK